MTDTVPEPVLPSSPTSTVVVVENHSPSSIELFQTIYRIERDGGSVIVVKGDDNEYYMQVMTKIQPVMEVHMVDTDQWNEYATWKRQKIAEMTANGQREVDNHSLRLENTIVAMQMLCPGRWDHKFVNENGEPYIEAVVGLNPLANGYSISAPELDGNSKMVVDSTGNGQKNDSEDPLVTDETVLAMPERTFSAPEWPEPEKKDSDDPLVNDETVLAMPERTFSAPEEPEPEKNDENKENIDPQRESVLERADN